MCVCERQGGRGREEGEAKRDGEERGERQAGSNDRESRLQHYIYTCHVRMVI